MYDDGYTNAFSLYETVDKDIPINYTDHANCAGFRYGKKYNNPSGKGLTSPKTLFLQQEKTIRECRFYGGNIVVKPVTQKDQ